MNNTSTTTVNFNPESASGSSNVPSKAEGIALCSAFIFTCVFIVVGNSLTIILFTMNKTLRKKSLFLVINMAFADLVLGAVPLPLYMYADVGIYFQLWTDSTGGMLSEKSPASIFYMVIDTAFSKASLISAAFISCERLYAIYWPIKHRCLSVRAYRIVICIVWILALFFSAVWTASYSLLSVKHALYVWVPFSSVLTFIICGCNTAIWRKFTHGGVDSQQQKRAAQNERLTKTLLFVSVLALLCWLPLILLNFLYIFIHELIPWTHYYIAVVVNYSNSFVNPIVYAFRIPEFRKALGLCCTRRGTAMNTKCFERRKNTAAGTKPVTGRRMLRPDPDDLQPAFPEDFTETKL